MNTPDRSHRGHGALPPGASVIDLAAGDTPPPERPDPTLLEQAEKDFERYQEEQLKTPRSKPRPQRNPTDEFFMKVSAKAKLPPASPSKRTSSDDAKGQLNKDEEAQLQEALQRSLSHVRGAEPPPEGDPTASSSFIPSKKAKTAPEEDDPIEDSSPRTRTEDDPYDGGRTPNAEPGAGPEGQEGEDGQGPPCDGADVEVGGGEPLSPMEDVPPPAGAEDGQDDPNMEGSSTVPAGQEEDPALPGNLTPTQPFDGSRWTTPPPPLAEPSPQRDAQHDDRLLHEMDNRFNRLESLFEKVVNQIGTNQNECFKKMEDIEKRCVSREKVMEKKIDDQGKNLHDQLKTINARIEKLEKEEKPKAAVPPPRSASMPSEPDPWSRYNEARAAPPPAAPARTTFPAARFTPSCVHLKGWSRFKENNGLGRDESKAFAQRILNYLQDADRQMVTDIRAPYIINRKIVLEIKDGGSNCYALQKKIAEVLRGNDITINQRSVYCIVEPSPEANAKTIVVAKASSCLEELIGDEKAKHVKVDMRAGTIYFAPTLNRDVGLVTIGNYLVKTAGWKWDVKNLTLTWPELGIPELQQLTERTLQE